MSRILVVPNNRLDIFSGVVFFRICAWSELSAGRWSRWQIGMTKWPLFIVHSALYCSCFSAVKFHWCWADDRGTGWGSPGGAHHTWTKGALPSLHWLYSALHCISLHCRTGWERCGAARREVITILSPGRSTLVSTLPANEASSSSSLYHYHIKISLLPIIFCYQKVALVKTTLQRFYAPPMGHPFRIYGQNCKNMVRMFSHWDHSVEILQSFKIPKFTILLLSRRMMIWDNDAMLHLAGFPDKVKRWGCWGTHRLSALFSVIEVSSSHLSKHAPSPPTCYTTYTTNTNCTQQIHIQHMLDIQHMNRNAQLCQDTVCTALQWTALQPSICPHSWRLIGLGRSI